MANNPKAKENLVAIPKGTTLNPHGRPKKFVSTLKAHGYKLSEINDCIKNLLAMTKGQLKEAQSNPQATALELMIIAAIFAAIKRGDLSTMETLISRTFGKPHQSVTVEESSPQLTDEQLAAELFRRLIQNRGLTLEDAIEGIRQRFPDVDVKLLSGSV
jgi:hypothetical protein